MEQVDPPARGKHDSGIAVKECFAEAPKKACDEVRNSRLTHKKGQMFPPATKVRDQNSTIGLWRKIGAQQRPKNLRIFEIRPIWQWRAFAVETLPLRNCMNVIDT
jgi:hypothetical protein